MIIQFSDTDEKLNQHKEVTWYLQMHLPYFILYIISGFQQEIVTLQGILRGKKKNPQPEDKQLWAQNSDTAGIFKLSDKNFKQLINSIYYLGKNWQHTRADGNTSRNSNKYKEVFKSTTMKQKTPCDWFRQ